MNVMTVIAHPNPQSFCHAILRQIDAGLKEAGHTNDIVDLYAMRFDPVFRTRDFASYIDESMPLEMLEQMDLMKSIMEFCGGPVQRFVAKRWLGNKTPLELVRIIRKQMPRDVVDQQDRLRRAQGLVFIAPNYWMNFPAILKGWFERVFSPGFAYTLTAEGWRGASAGRIPLLRHDKALVINTTHFREDTYQGEFGKAMARIIDDWGLRYPGIKNVDHVFFYGADVSTPEERTRWLDQAFRLGKDFSGPEADRPARSRRDITRTR
jgi:NAD(P)H dehydrogenase (quinone)